MNILTPSSTHNTNIIAGYQINSKKGSSNELTLYFETERYLNLIYDFLIIFKQILKMGRA